ncbi:unnamed protein product [Caenorhabditis sp. 36 PRJEB53466]|nr:unnamed protein product [Caenorhabditis sp. 36 PRJEB53466]
MRSLLARIIDRFIPRQSPLLITNIAEEMMLRNDECWQLTPLPPPSLLLRCANVLIDNVLIENESQTEENKAIRFTTATCFRFNRTKFLDYGLFVDRIDFLYDVLEKMLSNEVHWFFAVISRKNKIFISINNNSLIALHPNGEEWATDWQHKFIRLAFLRNISEIRIAYTRSADFRFLKRRVNDLIDTLTRVRTPRGWVSQNGQKSYRLYDNSRPPIIASKIFESVPRPERRRDLWGYVV